MDLKEIERTVAGLQQKLFRKSNSHSTGAMKSAFRGSGLQFKEHQIYNHGDDVRFIDWKLSAKSNQTYIKTFEEERNLEIVVILDLTPTMALGYQGKSKLRVCLEIIALLYLMVEKTNDKLKVVIWQKKPITIPPKSGKDGIVHLLSVMQNKEITDNNLNILNVDRIESIDNDQERMALLKSFLAKRKEVILLSDLNGFEKIDSIIKLLANKNMHCFKIETLIDKKKTVPYSLWTKTSNGQQALIKSLRKPIDSVDFPRKMRRISVESSYLDQFVRELM